MLTKAPICVVLGWIDLTSGTIIWFVFICEVRHTSIHWELWLWHFVLHSHGIKPSPLLIWKPFIDYSIQWSCSWDHFERNKCIIWVGLTVIKYATYHSLSFLEDDIFDQVLDYLTFRTLTFLSLGLSWHFVVLFALPYEQRDIALDHVWAFFGTSPWFLLVLWGC